MTAARRLRTRSAWRSPATPSCWPARATSTTCSSPLDRSGGTRPTLRARSCVPLTGAGTPPAMPRARSPEAAALMANQPLARPATDADREAWQTLVVGIPSGDVLHDWAWGEVAALDGQPQRRYVVEEEGNVVAVAAVQVRPTFLGRSFWYVPHGPVLDYDDARAESWVRLLVDRLAADARGHRGFVLRLEPRVEAGTRGEAVFDAIRLPRVEETLQTPQTRMVELRNDEELLAAFD